MPEKDPESWKMLINFLWLLIAIPIKLLWDRGNDMQATAKADIHDLNTEIKDLKKDLEGQSEDLNKHKLHVANNYLNKEDTKEIIEASIKPVKEGVDRIESLLNKNLKFHD